MLANGVGLCFFVLFCCFCESRLFVFCAWNTPSSRIFGLSASRYNRYNVKYRTTTHTHTQERLQVPATRGGPTIISRPCTGCFPIFSSSIAGSVESRLKSLTQIMLLRTVWGVCHSGGRFGSLITHNSAFWSRNTISLELCVARVR